MEVKSCSICTYFDSYDNKCLFYNMNIKHPTTEVCLHHDEILPEKKENFIKDLLELKCSSCSFYPHCDLSGLISNDLRCYDYKPEKKPDCSSCIYYNEQREWGTFCDVTGDLIENITSCSDYKHCSNNIIEKKVDCCYCIHYNDGGEKGYSFCNLPGVSVDDPKKITHCDDYRCDEEYLEKKDKKDSNNHFDEPYITINPSQGPFHLIEYKNGEFILLMRIGADWKEYTFSEKEAAAIASDSFKHTQDAIIKILKMISKE